MINCEIFNNNLSSETFIYAKIKLHSNQKWSDLIQSGIQHGFW